MTSRIYLNPALDKTVEIYREIFEEAERRDIAFRSKVFDFELRSSQRPESKIENIIDNGKIMRTDPVVFYGLASSQDELLGVVNKVYAKYRQSFKDRDTGSIPLQVAPGFALGAEPGVGGYSLTSHREEVMGRLLNALSETDWKLLDVGKRMSAYEERLRQAFRSNNIDPDNIAFNLTQN